MSNAYLRIKGINASASDYDSADGVIESTYVSSFTGDSSVSEGSVKKKKKKVCIFLVDFDGVCSDTICHRLGETSWQALWATFVVDRMPIRLQRYPCKIHDPTKLCRKD